jgi:hypothetical protein
VRFLLFYKSSAACFPPATVRSTERADYYRSRFLREPFLICVLCALSWLKNLFFQRPFGHAELAGGLQGEPEIGTRSRVGFIFSQQ